MITKYITQISASFNPLSTSRAHKIPRLILSRLPPSPAPGAAPIKVSTTILPQSSTQAGRVSIGFRDGKEIVFEGEGSDSGNKTDAIELKDLKMGDVIEELDRHSRILRRKEEIGER